MADLRAPTPSAAAELAQVDIYDLDKKINQCRDRCKKALKKKVEYLKLQYEKIMNSRVFTDPLKKINENYINVDANIKNLQVIIQNKIKDKSAIMENSILKLDALSPLKTLSRGYSIAINNKKIIKTIKQINKNDEIKIKLRDGEIMAEVLEIKEEIM